VTGREVNLDLQWLDIREIAGNRHMAGKRPEKYPKLERCEASWEITADG